MRNKVLLVVAAGFGVAIVWAWYQRQQRVKQSAAIAGSYADAVGLSPLLGLMGLDTSGGA